MEKRQSQTLRTCNTPPEAGRAPSLCLRPRRASRPEYGSGERLDRDLHPRHWVHSWTMCFPLFQHFQIVKRREWLPLNTSAVKALGEERAENSWDNTPCIKTNLFLKDNTQLLFRLFPNGFLHRGILPV